MKTKLIGDGVIVEEALQQMKKIGGTWAAYQNVDMSHQDLGELRFLKIGEGCTFRTAPDVYPDTPQFGLGWRYLHVGYVDLSLGKVVEEIR